MTEMTSVVRSVPMDLDGTPVDKSLHSISRAAHARAAEAKPSAKSDETHDVRFDARKFASSLPAPEKPSLTSLDEVAARAARTDTAISAGADKAKSKPRYIGARSEGEPYTLVDPLEWDGVEYRVAQIGSPRGHKFRGYVELFNAGEIQENIMVWLVTDLPIEVVKELSLEDKLHLVEVGKPFLPRQMRLETTEETSSSSEAATTTTTATN